MSDSYMRVLVFTPNGTDPGTLDITWMWSYRDGDPIPIQNPPSWVSMFLSNRNALVLNHVIAAKVSNGWLADVIALANDEGVTIETFVMQNPSLGMRFWLPQTITNADGGTTTLDVYQVLCADPTATAIAQGTMLYPVPVQTVDKDNNPITITQNVTWAAAIAQGVTIDPTQLLEPVHWAGW